MVVDHRLPSARAQGCSPPSSRFHAATRTVHRADARSFSHLASASSRRSRAAESVARHGERRRFRNLGVAVVHGTGARRRAGWSSAPIHLADVLLAARRDRGLEVEERSIAATAVTSNAVRLLEPSRRGKTPRDAHSRGGVGQSMGGAFEGRARHGRLEETRHRRARGALAALTLVRRGRIARTPHSVLVQVLSSWPSAMVTVRARTILRDALRLAAIHVPWAESCWPRLNPCCARFEAWLHGTQIRRRRCFARPSSTVPCCFATLMLKSRPGARRKSC